MTTRSKWDVLPACPRPRPVRSFASGVAWGAVVVLALSIAGPAALGWRTLSVMSGSMSPAIHTGDAVVTRPVAPASLRAGDVVTFRDPEGGDRLITHRVRWVRTVGDSVEVTTKGDANTTVERWQVVSDGAVGRVVYRLPKAGFVLAPSASPLGRLALVALPTFLLGALSLAAIWRMRPVGDEQPVVGPRTTPVAAKQASVVPTAPPASLPRPVLLALPPAPVLLALPPAPVWTHAAS